MFASVSLISWETINLSKRTLKKEIKYNAQLITYIPPMSLTKQGNATYFKRNFVKKEEN